MIKFVQPHVAWRCAVGVMLPALAVGAAHESRLGLQNWTRGDYAVLAVAPSGAAPAISSASR